MDTTRHNLPTFPTSFIGRADEITELSQLLDNPDCCLLTLVGPGGIGKTRLAVEVARAQLDDFADGVYFVPLQPLQAADQVLSAVIDALPLQIADDPQQQLLDYLSDKRLLLIMDNFEHLLASALLVSDILTAAPQVCLLATSREVLNLQGEWVRQVTGLTYPENGDMRSQPAHSAIQLFVERAWQLNGDFSLADDREHVIHICQLVAGMPLGIELAAGWIDTLLCSEIASEIERDLSILTSNTRDMPDRHLSMRAVLDHSWQRLDTVEQAVFRRLSVFRGGFEREAAEQVAGASVRTLGDLVRKSWLRMNGGRYDIQEVLRQYGADQLAAAGEIEPTHDVHCRYYADFLQQRELDIKGRRQLEGLNEIEADWHNVRVAWEWSLAGRNWDTISQMMETLHLFCDMRAHYADGDVLFQRTVDALEPHDGQQPHPQWGELLVRAAAVFDLRESVAAMDLARVGKFLERARQEADMGNNPLYLCVRANLFRPTSIEHNGIALLKASLEGFRVEDDRYSMARVLRWLAHNCAYLGGDYAEQFTSFNQQFLNLTREIGDEAGMTHALFYEGCSAFEKHQLDEAEHYFHEAGAIWRKMGDWKSVAVICYYLGTIAFRRGDFDQAKPLLQEATQLASNVNFDHIQRVAPDILGTIVCFEGDYVTGQRILFDLPPLVRALPRLGLVVAAYGLGDFQMARTYLQEITSWYVAHSRFEYETLGDPRFEKEALAVLPLAAILLAHDGELEWAVELLGRQASERTIPMSWFDQWALLAQVRDDLKRQLGAAAFEAAWERGKTLTVKIVMVQLLAYLGDESATSQAQANLALDEPLTPREREVLALLAQGHSNRQIAEELVIAVGTVKRYVYDICQKLDADNRTHAVARARELGLLT